MKNYKGRVIEVVESFLEFVGEILKISDDKMEITVEYEHPTHNERTFRVPGPIEAKVGDFVFINVRGIIILESKAEAEEAVKALKKAYDL